VETWYSNLEHILSDYVLLSLEKGEGEMRGKKKCHQFKKKVVDLVMTGNRVICELCRDG
jgi:hypothetical protein